MKKILIIAIMVLMPVTASAATIVPTFLNGSNLVVPTNLRLYDLEKAVAELQDQNTALQSKINLLQAQVSTQTPTIAPAPLIVQAQPDPRVDALENRVGALEKAVKYLQENVLGAINKTIGLLQQLLKK